MGTRGKASRAMQWLGLLVLTAAAAALCYLALTRGTEAGTGTALDDTTPSATRSEQPTESADAGENEGPKPPKVREQRRADFSKGDDLPDASELVDIGDNETGMALGEGGLTHGGAGESGGAGYLQTELKADVRRLGVRVQFARDLPGSVALVAWSSSLAAAAEDEEVDPPTGLRFVASPGQWRLVVVDDEEDVIAEGTYNALAGETVTFEVVRDERDLYVIDPTGAVTTASSPLAASLAGPWASWGLIEGSPDENPAVIEAVWAG